MHSLNGGVLLYATFVDELFKFHKVKDGILAVVGVGCESPSNNIFGMDGGGGPGVKVSEDSASIGEVLAKETLWIFHGIVF